ncbi:hypothetical protein MKZ38_000975 [Zalerion maritima]|uniref:Uncharacterized protein n=1 Tax=Zalerion maritima TaxID=339359 RepID=A0AAD5RS17_9PEZI|nr:hypothetical protein MKZ38_000975 [Zalerion maritima]
MGLRRTTLVLAAATAAAVQAVAFDPSIPSYNYGDPILVECMNRSSETGEHIQNEADEIQWHSFPTCLETSSPLSFSYGVEGEQNCTISMIDDPFFHLLEFYIHSDAPLACRLPASPPPLVQDVGPDAKKPKEQEYIPLVLALAGTLQLSHLHISTHLNVLLHSSYAMDTSDFDGKAGKRKELKDAGVLDSGIAYSTSPLEHNDDTVKLIIGDPLALKFSVRWFPTPELPHTEGKVEWQGMGGHVFASTVFYGLLAFGAGVVVSGVYFFGSVLPRRLKGRSLGGATPLGYGIGNGWGISSSSKGQHKRVD